MKKILIILSLIITELSMAQDFNFADKLFNNYENYKEQSLTKRRFKHSDIIPLINKLNKNIFTVKKAGSSVEGRDIFLISVGQGKTKVFLWSQMHGDESTATMALFDIFNFFSSDDLNDEKQKILENLTIYFMPMVNPDGAEVFQRRNDYDIDINRDAVRQQTPEGIVLRTTFEKLKADFGFNLHDQSTRYSVGHSPNSAGLSFLAPVTNYEKTMNPVRENSIKLIGDIYNVISKYMSGHIAKYSDDFEPRAFGDNFQKWGTSTILIESGGWKDDREKQFLRKMNFISMLSAFKSISDGSYKKQSTKIYDEIPFNEHFIMDVVLRNLECQQDDRKITIDLGINHHERSYNNYQDFYYRSSIEDLGDLSIYFGYMEFDLSGYTVEPGKIYDKKFTSINEIKNLDFNDLFKKGFTGVIVDSLETKNNFTNLPINIWVNRSPKPAEKIELGITPNLIIKKDNEVKYVVINGFVHNVENSNYEISNGIIHN